MIKTFFTVLILSLLFNLSFAQDITGKWYESALEKRSLELSIRKENGDLTGTYNNIQVRGTSTINGPLQKIIQKKDSLILIAGEGDNPVSYRLVYDEKTGNYSGYEYSGDRRGQALRFGRTPVKRNLKAYSVQERIFTREDTIRGSITPEREWWDLSYYHLDVKIDPEAKYISGKNLIQYRVLKPHKVMQIDLQPPLVITKVTQNGKELSVRHDGNAHFINLKEDQVAGKVYNVKVWYEGNPLEAENAPWDGGFSWKNDSNGNHFIATSCQGIGASIWWPNKDHMYDEVDSMLISVTIPKGLTNISNGRLRKIEENPDNTVTSHWFVSSPINNYGVNVNIADYVHFSEVYQGEKGPLDMDYYVLRDNLEKAKVHFTDAPKMMEAFEHWFGPYPFYEDGFKLVETPYLGMEHQSSVTYGNKYLKGYLGRDVSGSGWGLKFDFIIIHESGHEWFANNITYRDIADMWIHESFINYSENLYVDFHYGKKAASEYVIGTRKGIANDRPIVGEYNVNSRGSGDMYSKGGNMLHTLRQVVDDDEKWRQILRGLNEEFYHQTVTGKQVEDYISKQTGMDLEPFFNQYLRTVNIPTLEYYIEDNKLIYRWLNTVDNFDMPVRIFVNEEALWIYPRTNRTRQFIEGEIQDIKIDPNFYVGKLSYPGL